MPRASRPRTLRAAASPACEVAAALALFALLTPTAGAQTAAAVPVELTAGVRAADGTAVAEVTAADLTATWGGLAVAVGDVAPVAPGSWQVAIYLDPALLTPGGLQDAALALAGRAGELTALGEVELLVADPYPEAVAGPTTDAAVLAAELERLGDAGAAAGELSEIRYQLTDAAAAGGSAGAAPELADRLLAEETALLRQARDGLLGWLAAQPPPRPGTPPRALVLVQDGFDADPLPFYRQSTGGALTPPPAVPEPWETVVRAAVAGGWTVLALALGDAGDVFAAARAPLAEIAEAGGGELVTLARGLDGALGRLTERHRVTLDLPRDFAGGTRPLELAAVREGWRLAAPRWAAAGAPEALAVARARRLVADPDSGGGPLAVEAALLDAPAPVETVPGDTAPGDTAPDETAPGEPIPGEPAPGEPATAGPTGAGGAEATAFLPAPALRRAATAAGPAGPAFRVTVLIDRLDAEPLVVHALHGAGDPAALDLAAGWLAREPVAPGADVRGGAVVVEELVSGLWGAAPLELTEGSAMLAPGVVAATTLVPPPTGTAAASASATAAATGSGRLDAPTGDPAAPAAGTAPTGGSAPGGTPPAPAARPAATAAPRDANPVIVLLPPRRTGIGPLGGGAVSGAVSGRVRLETLVTRPEVGRVTFYLDGEEVAADDRQPFTTVVDLGPEARPRTLRAVAWAAGRSVGEATLTINAGSGELRVAIDEVAGDPASGSVEVTAGVEVPAGARLDRVEMYFGESLAATLRQPPFRARVPTPGAGPEDYLRVVAYLADGTSMEDVRLLAAAGAVERVEVNLVELFAVVADRSGAPLQGLGASDFEVRLGGATLPLDRFQVADEVPLVLGLLVDTSESMWPLMPDTKRAASRFLSETLRPADRAFLVSFDDEPRLIRPATGDLLELLSGFGALRATGRTALYDAIVFSMLRFEATAGRRALVLITDGFDWGSRFGPKRCIEYGRQLGVPVYILVFGDLYGDRRPRTQPDLDAVTARTGGRVYYIDTLERLAAVYDEITSELRNQYVLAVSTERRLDADELGRIEVRVPARRGAKVRAAVAGGTLE